MLEWYIGTVGFAYKDWDGCFYPDKTPQREYLKNYARIFNAVEIDSSFYGTPQLPSIMRWKAIAPENFKFCFKTPRQITHELHLLASEKEFRKFINAISNMEGALGPTLIQMPPDFSLESSHNLVAFLEKLDLLRKEYLETKNLKLDFAIEFRNESWYVKWTTDLLSHHNVSWVTNDYLDYPKVIMPTADFLYCRWIGKHGRFAKKDKLIIDQTNKLQWWHEQIKKHLSQRQTDKIFGFFNNDFSGHSPATANKFKEIVGLDTKKPEIYEQETLF